jgi:hypothetical protein
LASWFWFFGVNQEKESGMMSREKVVGLYADAAAVAANPGYLDTLKHEIGLNRIILGGGFNLSAKTRALNPLTGGAAPALTLVEDDTPIRKAIDQAHKQGVQVWCILGGYHGGAEQAPDLMVHALSGERMDAFPPRLYSTEQSSYTYCPNNERINAWFEAVQVEIAARYDFQGYALTHVRYTHPAFFEQMLACGCPTCQKKAAELGYDFPRMKKAVLGSLAALKSMPAGKLRTASRAGLGFFDFLQVLGQDSRGVVDWFNFRADAISLNQKRFSQAVHAVRPDFLYGMDIHYPTMALLVGHRYSDLAACCDQILPLLSHNEIHFLDNLGSFATILTNWVEGLGEVEAVSLVYKLIGIQNPDMPVTVKAMHLGEPPTAEPKLEALLDLVASEMYKARLYSGEKVLSYPVIKGSIWPGDTVRRLMEVAFEAGHDGIILQGTDSLFKSSH